MTLTPQLITDAAAWNAYLQGLPHAHILQSWPWGEHKATTTGWHPEHFAYAAPDGTVQAVAGVLTRRVGPLRVMYAPRGPALDYTNADTLRAVLAHLEGLARRRHVVWLKIDPDLPRAFGLPAQADPDRPDQPHAPGLMLEQTLEARGWRFSASQVQFRNTLVHDLTPTEDDLLAAMNQSTRRKIRKADKAGVVIRPADLTGTDLDTLYALYGETSARQGFIIRPLDYYRALWQRFAQAGYAHALLAEWEGRAIAGVVLLHLPPTVWYFYGMSGEDGREAQPNYALQWAALRWAKSAGYTRYDWWGAPDDFAPADPMWGVYRFKDGFGGRVVRGVGAWDYIPHAALHTVYENIIPRVLGWLRNRS